MSILSTLDSYGYTFIILVTEAFNLKIASFKLNVLCTYDVKQFEFHHYQLRPSAIFFIKFNACHSYPLL